MQLTAEQVAERLSRTVKWVYRHKHALGAVRVPGSRLLSFPENVIEKIEKGELYAVPSQIRKVEGGKADRRQAILQSLRNQKGSAGLGKRGEKDSSGTAGNKNSNRHGLGMVESVPGLFQ